ncbi:hypothetical protein AAG570_008534 [Ranatra chinensis]|uniref:Major facilitator superfamily (MFS) profile domain-containing protein n=1 Tax=Ranatra chinensis TaxID=642074 RepID=A0ABD0YRT3_9HEMI
MSIRIIYFTVFLMSFGFSIVLTGVWPYLNKLDKNTGKEFMGYVVAANPFAQMLFSPVAGWWANKLGAVRWPLITSVVVFILSSSLYSILELFISYRRYWMLLSRFFVGVSSANMAVCRSYLSAATKLEERTGAVSMISLAQVLGFAVGPALQAAVTPLGDVGYVIWENRFSLDMYTASGWISAALGVINLILLFPIFFQERTIAAKEAMILSGAATEKAAWKEVKPDYISTWTLIMAFFIFSFNFVLLETLGTSLTMDQFAWTKEEALYYMGILMSAGALTACATFAVLSYICKRFGELNVLMWGGFLLMLAGGLSLIPWGTSPPLIAYPVLLLDAVNISGTSSLGCPVSQEWCSYTPAMTIKQFLVGFALISFGYPIGITLIQTVFSKVLGPRPQGVWMGLMTGSGCLSRVMGPVFVSFIYTRLGPIWTFSITAAMMAATLIWLRLLMKRLKTAYRHATRGNECVKENGINNDIEMIDMSRNF